MKTILSVCCIVTVFLFNASAMAQDKVIVIPLNISPSITGLTNLENIVTVSLEGGDFADPLAAVDSITNATAKNPYLVVIGPGVYTLSQTLYMKPWVSIIGFGQENTRLTGSIGDGQCDYSEIGGASTDPGALIVGADNASLRDLAIENTGSLALQSVGFYNDNSSPTVQDVTITVSGTGFCSTYYGVQNVNSSAPIMTNMIVTVTGNGAGGTLGVLNDSSSPVMSTITIITSGGMHNSAVVNRDESAASLNNVTAKALNGSQNIAIENISSTPIMTDVIATAIGGTSCIGVDFSLPIPVIPVISTTKSDEPASVFAEIYPDSTANIDFSTLPSDMTNVIATASGGTSYSYGLKNGDLDNLILHSCTIEGQTFGIVAGDDTATSVAQSSIIGGILKEGTGSVSCVDCDNGADKELDEYCEEIIAVP